jgi:predicted O-linked N-acetylglucosamine transferase (SPINDLY family)
MNNIEKLVENREYLAALKLLDEMQLENRQLNYKILEIKIYSLNKNYDKAIHLIEKLSYEEKNSNEIKKILLRIYLNTGKFDECLRITEEMKISSESDNESLNLYAAFLDLTNKKDVALKILNIIINKDCKYAEAYATRAVINYKNDEITNAIEDAEKALLLKPKLIELKSLLLNCYKSSKNYKRLIEELKKALTENQRDDKIWSELGDALYNINNLEAAKKCFNKSLEINELNCMALNGLGMIFHSGKNYSEAMSFYLKALKLETNSIEINNNIATAYLEMGEIKQAIYSCRRLLQLDASHPDGNCNLAVALTIEKEYSLALSHIEKALLFNKNNSIYLNVYSSIKCYLSDFKDIQEYGKKSIELDKSKNPSLWESYLYGLIYHPDLTDQEICNEHIRWGAQFGDRVLKHSKFNKINNKLIRVGYVSPDFSSHSCRFYFEPLFSNHNKNKFEIIAYSNVQEEDEHTQRFKKYFSTWRDISNLTDEQAANLIAADEVDILVDACGHMRNNRLGVFTHKPAPLQVTWLGAAWTTGLKQIDFAIFDSYMAPEGTFSSEKILRLPSTWAAFRPGEKALATIVNELPAIKNGYITFGYSGRTERLNYKVFNVWAEILNKIPNSKIILDFKVFNFQKNIEYYSNIFRKNGIDNSRIVMRYSTDIFRGLQDFDIMLDSFPHSGGTMLFDAVWMGVPVVTLASRPPVGRIGASLMSNIGLKEWIAVSENDYIQKCVTFSSSLEVLACLRAEMRSRLINSPVMNESNFASEMECCYEKIINEHEKKLNLKNYDNKKVIKRQSLKKDIKKAAYKNNITVDSLIQDFNSNNFSTLQNNAEEFTREYPKDKRGWDLLGAAYVKNNRLEDAVKAYSRAIELAPNDVNVLNNCGIALRKIGRKAEAIDIYKKAISLSPDFFSAYINLVTTLVESNMIQGAIDVCEHLIRRDPSNKEVYNKIAFCYGELGDIFKAAEYCKIGIKKNPDNPYLIQMYSAFLAKLSKFDNVNRYSDYSISLANNDKILWESHLFTLIYNPLVSEKEIVDEHIKWGKLFYGNNQLNTQKKLHNNSKIKIGYLSPDFRGHSCKFYFEPLFSNHDKNKFELFALSNVQTEDVHTQEFKKYFDKWLDIKNLSDSEVQNYIGNNKIDILIDGCGHMRDHRFDVFSAKPAPIQITWLGAAWTTGLPQMDFAIFDPYMAPPETLASEEIYRLPHTWAAFRPSHIGRDIECSSSPVVLNKYITFGYSGRTERLNAEVFKSWASILGRVKNSRLILDYKTFSFKGNADYFLSYLTNCGISSDKIIFKNSSNIFDGLSHIDILLDSFPHSGGTMLYDAVWMGLPFVTLSRRAPVGRIGTSILNNIGLSYLVASSFDEYVNIAVDLANNIDHLILLRSTIRQRMIDSPIMNESQFAKDMENAFLEILNK